MFLKPVFFRMWCGRMEKSRVDRSASWDLASKETATVAPSSVRCHYPCNIAGLSREMLSPCCGPLHLLRPAGGYSCGYISSQVKLAKPGNNSPSENTQEHHHQHNLWKKAFVQRGPWLLEVHWERDGGMERGHHPADDRVAAVGSSRG